MKTWLNKKSIVALALAVILLLPSVLLSACGSNKPADNETTKPVLEGTKKDTEKETEKDTETETTEQASTEEVETTKEEDTRSSAEIAENAMNNFLKKVEAGNYVIDFKDHLKISVCSDDLVVYELGDKYGIGFGDGVAYFEMAVMTINDKETFCGYFGENNEELIHFGGEGKALELTNEGTASQVIATRLLNYWLDEDVTDGNIWNIFTNYDSDQPLSFIGTGYGNVVPETMKILGGLGESAFGRMQDIYLEFEEEDVQTAHLKTSFAPGLTPVPDIDIVITFGNAEPEKRADAWMKNEDRKLPEVKTAWNETDEMNLNSVFVPPYGLQGLPFPKFATYAFIMDISHILSDGEIRLRDLRATEEDMESYVNQLTEDGFTAVKDEDGDTVYRKLLREEYQCYSSIELEYDNAVNIVARKYYDFPTYEGLEGVNKVISDYGYAELPENSHLSDFDAINTASELTESWLYLFDYDLSLYVDLEYDSREEAEKYLEAYINSLSEKGFEPKYGSEEDEEYEEPESSYRIGLKCGTPKSLTDIMGEDNYMQLKTKEGMKSFRYHFEPDGETLDLLFKAETYVTIDEAVKQLTEAGFPKIDIPEENFDLCRDIRKFEKTMYGHETIADLSLAMAFEKAESDAESADGRAWLDDLFDNRLIPDDFVKAGPEDDVNMNKNIVFFKEFEEDGTEKRLVVGMNYLTDLTLVNLEFRLEDVEPEEP